MNSLAVFHALTHVSAEATAKADVSAVLCGEEKTLSIQETRIFIGLSPVITENQKD